MPRSQAQSTLYHVHLDDDLYPALNAAAHAETTDGPVFRKTPSPRSGMECPERKVIDDEMESDMTADSSDSSEPSDYKTVPPCSRPTVPLRCTAFPFM